ncbi:type I restriction enzyme S subunit [Clostridium algifaecis]|uniref:Type I restriction enzyme S subunit n=1 Tax=Clostridium algifaecis TaxID=1472040 RepID=A0ABS4KRS1_9CLOT|nr:restriction endonuclease subunit S [Clostridium algifaecis]MBP2032732.1 type I restriction enzyme S subunit [Clostridium algifaecis]
MSSAPKLRFKEFCDKWKKIMFYDCVSIRNGQVNPKEPPYSQMPHIGPANIEKYTGRLLEYKRAYEENLVSGKYYFNENDIIYSKIRPNLAKVAFPKFCGICSADAYPIETKKSVAIPEFIFYYMLGERFTKYAVALSERTKMPKINRTELAGFDFNIPSIAEQKKITKFLSVIDKKMQIQQKKVEYLQDYKKGIVQRVFSQEIRFKDENGEAYPEWGEIQLSEVLAERKTYSNKGLEYPHVTLSIDGIYDKGERYERDFLVKTENKKYKITLLGDICYNPANLKFGVISVNNYGSAIFSPIYVTFEVKKMFDYNFIGYLLMRKDFIDRIRKYEEGTVYERMAVKPEDFLKYKTKFPCLCEQEKIAKFFLKIDEKIQKEKDKLELLSMLRKGLLQQMFV